MSHVPVPLPRRAAGLVPVLPLVAVVALLALPPTGTARGPPTWCPRWSSAVA